MSTNAHGPDAARQAPQRARTDTCGAFISIADPGSIEHVTTRARSAIGGLPFAVKDNIDTADLPTTAGTPALARSRPARNHPAVDRLLNAGATMIGKTNLHELAFGITSNNGWSGAVRNPHDPSRSAGGSSGGSAAAVAAGIVPFALATDTGGSATIPAAMCGVVGYRPSVGRYGAGHAVPLSSTRDTVGVIANNMSMLQAVDTVLADDARPVHASSAIRLGLPSHGYLEPLGDDVSRAWHAALERLRAQGIECVPVDTRGIHGLEADSGPGIVFHEAMNGLPRYLLGLPDGAPSLPTLIDGIASPDVAQLMAEAARHPRSEAQYQQCLRVRQQLRNRLNAAAASQAVDALIYPTCPITATPIGDDVTTRAFGRTVPVFATVARNAGPGSVAGRPVITLPCDTGSALPVGISLEAGEGMDAELIRLAIHIEQALIAQ